MIKPFYQDSQITEYHGHTPDVLKELPAESVHMVVTSVPYWGLRDYGLEPQVWDGDEKCEHEWETVIKPASSGSNGCETLEGGKTTQNLTATRQSHQSQFCQKCNAWRGSLGLEPTPELYIQHIVQVFQEVKRVLRKDGTCWLNIGDSYWGSGQGSGHDEFTKNLGRNTAIYGVVKGHSLGKKHQIYKPKDLCMIPARVALALQADGWWLRSDIIWCLSGGTKLYAKTQKGVMPQTLKDLARLDPKTIKLWNGKQWTQVLGWQESKRQGNEIEIEIRSGERINCTPEHRWPLEDGTLIKAKNLKEGHILKACKLPEMVQIPIPKGLSSKRIGYFIGLYIAEGSRDPGETIQIASHKLEIEQRYAELRWLAYDFHGKCRYHITGENQGVICIESRILNAILDTYVAGRTAIDKHLTNACWERENEFLEDITYGYLQGDAHWDTDNRRWRLGFTRNYYWEQDLRTICARLGWQLRLKLSKAKYQDGEKPSFRGEIRIDRTHHFNQKLDTEIVAIRKSRSRKFWDVTVEDEPHLFALASGVLTHNSKPNPMPESVTDRPTTAHEHVFLLAKSQKYFYDAEGVKEESIYPDDNRKARSKPDQKRMPTESVAGVRPGSATYSKRNLRSVWTIEDDGLANWFKWYANQPEAQMLYDRYADEMQNKSGIWTIATEPTPEAHFATFPAKLCEIAIKAGTSEKGCCPECGASWVRVVEKQEIPLDRFTKTRNPNDELVASARKGGIFRGSGQKVQDWRDEHPSKTIGWRPSCECKTYRSHPLGFKGPDIKIPFDPIPCTVLDPFSGSGRALIVSKNLGRKAIGIDLKAEYLKMPLKKLAQERLI